MQLLCDTNILQGLSSTLTYVISMTMAKNVLTTSTRKLTLTGLKLNLPSVFLLMCTSTGCSPAGVAMSVVPDWVRLTRSQAIHVLATLGDGA